MSDIAISISNVSKCYQVFDDQRSKFLHALWPNYIKNMNEVWALKDINFEIKRGEAVAIIGRNGGGKSTLLQIITGTLTPTTGEVKVNGRVSALLELGSGFNPEYSGRDNVILNGLLIGLSREQILSRFHEIESFADIGVAIDRPVKTYSSGMMMRLAFAVQVLCEPDILIIDEALSVGDFFFQQKCLSYIRGLCDNGVTLLFVSHDMGTVRDICKRAIYLVNGEVSLDGETTPVIHRFLSGLQHLDSEPQNLFLTCDDQINMSKNFEKELTRVYSNAVWKDNPKDKSPKVLAVAIFDDFYNPTTAAKVGDVLRVLVAYQVDSTVDYHVSIEFLNKFDQTVSVTGSYHAGLNPNEVISNFSIVIFEARIVMNLEAGNYSLGINLGKITSINKGYAVHLLPKIGPISLSWDYDNEVSGFLGICGLPVTASYSY